MGKDLKKKDLGKGITQQKNKKYRVRFKVSDDYTIDQEFDTEREAKSFLDTTKYEVEHGLVLSERSTTVNEVFKKWIEHKIAIDRAENTIRNYRNRYFFNIKDEIGSMRIVDVKPIDIQGVLNKMKADYATSTIQQTYDTMRGLFWFAVGNDYIRESPVTKGNIVEIPEGGEPKEIDFFTVDEQRRFLQVAKDLQYYEQFALMLFTGLRISEVVGLTWDCVDLEKKTITVDKNLEYRYDRKREAEIESEITKKLRKRKTRNGELVNADGWRWGPPKTKNSYRTIEIPQQAVDILERLKDRPYLKESTPDEFRDLVFLCKRTGLPVRSNTYDNAIRKRIDTMTEEENEKRLKEGLEPLAPHYLSCHDFRHTFATRFLESSKETNYVRAYKSLSKRLGHGSIKITLDLYSHLTEESEDELTVDFETYLSKVV